MKAPGTNCGDLSLDTLEHFQRSIKVDLIMTSRQQVMTCRREETVADIKKRNKGKFSYLPVVDDEERIVGLYNADQSCESDAQQEQIGKNFIPFSEVVVIGADASIIDFVLTADKQPTRLVISGDQVTGLVNLTDLQKLPVRAALFALITRLEIAMADEIENEFPSVNAETPGWFGYLSKGRKDKILQTAHGAKDNDGFVSYIHFSQFSDKADILMKMNVFTESKGLKTRFKTIRKLRDAIAHANHYAASPCEALKTCETVKSILQLTNHLIANSSEK